MVMLTEAAELLSLIYGPIGDNHVRGVIHRHGLDSLPEVVFAHQNRVAAERSANASRARARVKAVPAPVLPKMPGADLGTAGRNKRPTLFELNNTQCHRPLWDKSETDIHRKFYCGAPVPDGARYCEACSAVMYTPRETRKAPQAGRRPFLLLQATGRWS